MKKTHTLLISGILSALGLTLLAGISMNGHLSNIIASSCNHSGYHYEGKAATATQDGWNEYWVCCKCHESFLSKPDGTFANNSAFNMVGGEPGPGHIAYLPQLIGETKVLVVADLHVNSGSTEAAHLRKTLNYIKDNNYDVVIFNGDIVDCGISANYQIVDNIFEDVFASVPVADRPEFLFNMGNHEFYPNTSCRHQDTVYSTQQDLFFSFANKWMKSEITDNVYTRKINGVTYIIACPGPEYKDGEDYLAALGGYSSQDFADLKDYLDEATKNDEPVVLATHHPFGYTYGGSNYGMPTGNVVNTMKTLLSNYPSVINFTSHTHFSNLHERALDQTNYTSVNVGMHCFGKYVSSCEQDENGETIMYQNVASRRMSGDSQGSAQHGATHFGLEVNFDDEITISRINLAKGEKYSHGEWTIPYGINSTNKHEKFYYEAGEREGEEMKFAAGSELTASANVGASSSTINVSFTDVENYWAVEGYKVEVVGSTGLVDKRTWWQSLFWADLGHKTTYSFDISEVKLDSEYTINVYPMDFFGVYGNPLTKTITTFAERTSEEELEISSSDLFYLSTVYSSSYGSNGYVYDNHCTDTADANSGYSYKVSCDVTGDGWPGIKYKLPKAIDMTNSKISLDVKFINAHKWFSVKLYDSTNTLVCGEPGIDASSSDWSHQEFSKAVLQSKTKAGKNLGDVMYIEFYVNFDKYSGVNQSVIFDNLQIETDATYSFITYTSSTTIKFSEIGGENLDGWTTSNKRIEFYTNTTSKILFALVAANDGTRVSAKVTITIGDGTNIAVTDVQSSGYTVTSVGGGVYKVSIRIGSINVNGSNGSMTAGKINFRDSLPVNICDLKIV